MKLLRIYNDWLLCLDELRLLWCSSKSWSNTIWKFGTWLKYAISVLVRNNIDFGIYIWWQKVELQTEKVQIRDNYFDKVIIDYESTSITTNLWVEWSVWQGLREFIANALDEDGWYEIVDSKELETGSDQTVVTFDLEQVQQYLSDFDFDNWIETEEGYYYKKLETPRRAKVFKQWFLVYEAGENSSYDYRIDDLKINESRVAEDRHEVKRGIAQIQSFMDKEDVEVIIENKETDLWTFYDYDDLWNWWEDVKRKDIWKNDGYELQKLVHNNIKKDTHDDKEYLLYSDLIYISKDNEIEKGIYLQDEESEDWIKWDINPKTLEIFIWKQYTDWYYINTLSNEDFNYSEIIQEAKDYRRAAQYVKDHKFKTAIDTAQYFLKKEEEKLFWLITLDKTQDKTYINI